MFWNNLLHASKYLNNLSYLCNTSRPKTDAKSVNNKVFLLTWVFAWVVLDCPVHILEQVPWTWNGAVRGCFSWGMGSVVKCIHWMFSFLPSGHFWDTFWDASLVCLFWAMFGGECRRVSIFVRICLGIKSRRKDPQDIYVLQYCITNSWRAFFGCREDFFIACLKVCTKRSATPLVAGW